MRKPPEFHFPPIFKKLKRGGPAVILPKDAGMIISYANINKNSRILECGGGSGFLTVALAGIAKEVVTYEFKSDFFKLVENNVKASGLNNVTVKNKDILSDFEESENFDAAILDMQYAEKAVKSVYAVLKKDCFLVGYLPNLEQAKEFYLECQKYFEKTFMLENIVREYEVRDFGVRPAHFGLMHTAYLVFAKK